MNSEEQHKLNCLTRYLYHGGRAAQEAFYARNPKARAAMIDRIRELIANELAAMPTSQRRERLQKYQVNPELYADLQARIQSIERKGETDAQ